MLNQLAEDLWVTSQPLRFVGAEIGCRMTCIRLSSGGLVLHSPIRATPELTAAVHDLGPVAWLVAPNAFHHMFIGEWQECCPDAALLVAPKLLKKRGDLSGATKLSEAPGEWGDELEVVPIDGFPMVDEYVFFHRPSSTLILTDLAFNFDRDCPFVTRWFIRLCGRLGQLSPTIIERLMIRNKSAFRASLNRVMAWPFDRVVVSHGKVLESGGREALARGYDTILRTDS